MKSQCYANLQIPITVSPLDLALALNLLMPSATTAIAIDAITVELYRIIELPYEFLQSLLNPISACGDILP